MIRTALFAARRPVFAGRYAEALADAKLLDKPVRQMGDQPIGDLVMLFPALENARDDTSGRLA